MRIFKNPWFEKFARKSQLFDASLVEAVARANLGLIDADLGGGLIKQRVARAGGGRSGGYRTIIVFRSAGRAVFVFGFAKSSKANLTADEEAALRKAAKLVLSFSEVQMDAEVGSGRLMEISSDDKDIQK